MCSNVENNAWALMCQFRPDALTVIMHNCNLSIESDTHIYIIFIGGNDAYVQ